jgi:Flp pilus assembly protein TadG
MHDFDDAASLKPSAFPADRVLGSIFLTVSWSNPFGRAVAASSQCGQAIIEVTLLIPWIVIAFVAAFNFGIFAYALVSTQNAARSAAMYASQSLTVAQSGSIATEVCLYALGELRDAPGVGSGVTTCTGMPVTVTVTPKTPGAGDMNTVQVSVTYNTMQLIALPGLMAGSLAIKRTVEMPIRN